MFQQLRVLSNIDKLFLGLPNLFGIAEDVVIVGFILLGIDHDGTVDMKKSYHKTAHPRP